MRAIFILLVAANLAFFGYQFFFTSKDEAVIALQKAVAPVGDKNLRLLSEQEGELPQRQKTAPSIKAELGADKDGQKNADFCTMIGPYGQLLQAEFAVERLASLGASAHITPVEIKEGESYWVYLKPEVSEKEAVRRLYELQKKNIESHVITKGELANGISFGRYGDYGDAEKRATEIKQQGYDVDIKMLPKVIQETWVVVDAGFAEKIDESVWMELLTKESALEKRQNFCLGVASQ